MKLKTFMMLAAGTVVGTSSALAEDMTIVSFGGAYSASQNNAYHQPYMIQNPGISIINDDSSNDAIAKLRAMKEANNVTWDVVDVLSSDAVRACDEGLAMEIDHDSQLAKAPDGSLASVDFGEAIISPCLIPHVMYSTTFGYRTDMVGDNPPDDICDVFDLKTYPGKRALEKRPINNVEWALLCDGVAKENVYGMLATSEGVERALAKLDTIKDQIVWWSAGAETPQLLADGEIVIGSTYNGRLFALIEEQKQPVGMMWDAQVIDVGGWIIPEGLSEERKKQALHYLNFATDTQRLADQAQYISYGPARASSAPLVGKHASLGVEMAPHMPNSPANAKNVIMYNFAFWADHRDDIDAKFQSWLTK